MSFENEKGADRRRKSDQPALVETSKKQSKKKAPASGEVGTALRSVYQRTIEEQIPRDLLDLLGKLG